MTIYQEVDLAKSYLLLNHGPTTMISTAFGDKRNIMTVAWAMPLDLVPPRVAVVVSKESYTYELIAASGEFAILIPSKAMAQKALQAGTSTGREIDKFKTFGITTQPAKTVSAPLIDGCLGCLECKLMPEPHNQKTYDLFIAEVSAAWADPRVFSNGRWHMQQGELRSIHYQAGGEFFAIGESFEVKGG